MSDQQNPEFVPCPDCTGLGKRPRVVPLNDQELEQLKKALHVNTFQKAFDIAGNVIVMRAISVRDFDAWREQRIKARVKMRSSLGVDASMYRPDEIEELISQAMTKDFIKRHVVEWNGRPLTQEELDTELDNITQAQLDQAVDLSNRTDDEFKNLLYRAVNSDQIKK